LETTQGQDLRAVGVTPAGLESDLAMGQELSGKGGAEGGPETMPGAAPPTAGQPAGAGAPPGAPPIPTI